MIRQALGEEGMSHTLKVELTEAGKDERGEEQNQEYANHFSLALWGLSRKN
jgi:hypothetical protein